MDYGKVVARDVQGKPLRMIGAYKDISDRKHKELALQQAMEAAEAANLAKSMFLANMSHELRTPLNVILGFTQVMAHDPSLTPSQREDLQTIRRSGDHLLSLINDVLDLSKIEAGHALLEETGFDLISLLHTLRSMMGERAQAKQLNLTFDIAPEVPQFVIADDQKLRQILLNLLSNAIKFTRQGSVTLRVRVLEERTAERENGKVTPQPLLSPGQLTLQFEVADTGVGLTSKELDIIFDAFVQAEAGKQSVSGTGLGLTISRKLLELMGGTIAVQSIPDRGSTFTVTLPVYPTSSSESPLESYHRTVVGLVPGQPSHRVLVVDDQLENRHLMVRLLTLIGLEVREASNGQEAVSIWQEWHPALTWMDIRMPGLDGYEATRQIRALEQGSGRGRTQEHEIRPTVIIALTAQASHSDRTLALAAGCNDYISKPFREETVFLKLSEYLGLEYLYTEQTLLPNPVTLAPCRDIPEELSLLEPAIMAQLPSGWLEAVDDAALCGDDRAIAKLVARLDPELAPLGHYLTELADRFQFEQILSWVNNAASSGSQNDPA